MKFLLLNTVHKVLKPDLKVINSLCKYWLYLPSKNNQVPAWIFKQIPLPLYKDRAQ